ncbi:MAG TPA: LysR family transcriptional regulator, partial [Micromonospora sp.]
VARALSYSPSTISQQLSQLEAETGERLLEPVGRRVRLTPQAEILVEHTEALLARLERAEADLAASLHAVTGTLRVAAFQTAALNLIPAALTDLAGRHPALRVRFTQMEPERALPGLLAHDFDLVIGEEYPGHPQPLPPQFEQRDLSHDPLRLVLPRFPADPSEPVGLTALADRAWVREPEGTAARQWSVALCRTAGFEPDVRFESSDLMLHLRLVETGHAVALLPDLVWAGRPPTVDRHPLPGAPARRISTIVRRGAERHPAVEALRDSLSRSVRPRRQGGPQPVSRARTAASSGAPTPASAR